MENQWVARNAGYWFYCEEAEGLSRSLWILFCLTVGGSHAVITGNFVRKAFPQSKKVACVSAVS